MDAVNHTLAQPPGKLGKIVFSDQFYRMIERSPHLDEPIEVPTTAELEAALNVASSAMALADPDLVMRIHERCPEAFRFIRAGAAADRWPMIAYLPLNSHGVAALIDGRFDGRRPDFHHLAIGGEAPEGIYLWLLFAPGNLTTGMRLIDEITGPRGGRGVPMFSRPIHRTSERILKKIGCVPASQFFPSAPDWLHVALPSKDFSAAASGIEISPVTGMSQFMQIVAIRSAAYMHDQYCPYREEFDGNDFCATHLLGMINGDPAGCARIRYFGDFAKLERFAVRREYRRTRLMFHLARACIEHCRRKGFRKIYAHARVDLVPLWARFGARPMKDRPPFSFSNVVFQEMEMDVEPTPDAVRFGADPLVTIRPEGAWRTLGPLDRAQLVRSEGQSRKIEEAVKRFGAPVPSTRAG